MENIFAVYKPKGPTSHDIVDEIRKITGVKKVGHAGTLDPLASGILVVGVGREATKRLGEVVKKEKEYIAEIKLGEESTTDDEEGEKNSLLVDKLIGFKEIENAVGGFVGKIMQVPPAYSAIKIKGKPAHRRVRHGERVQLRPRKVKIREIEILNYKWPFLRLRVVAGSGVYIRALARDIGRKIGVGGYLYDLERVGVGEFGKKKAIDVSRIKFNRVKQALK